MKGLKKREDESLLGYYKRITDNRKELDLDYSEWGKLVCGKEYNSENARKAYYCIKPMLDNLEDCIIEKINDNQIIAEIEAKKIELEKEKVRFQDQKREYKAYLRADARFEHIKDTIREEIGKLNITKELDIPIKDIEVDSEKEAVLILSDWHIGVVNDNYWNKFNLEIAKERISKLLAKTIEYCKLNKVRVIHIELLGDLVNGYIHVGNRIENEEDVISQTFTAAEILCEFIAELSKYISKIKIYSSTGNHGRCSANIKESIELENFERIIPWYLKGRLDSERIEMVENEIDSNIIIMRFLNEVIYCVHGHLDKPVSVVNNLSQMLKEFPTECHLGHFHSFKEFDEYDITTTVNGTLSGVDNYAKKIRKVGSPMQTLMIYNKDGRECTYKIKL